MYKTEQESRLQSKFQRSEKKFSARREVFILRLISKKRFPCFSFHDRDILKIIPTAETETEMIETEKYDGERILEREKKLLEQVASRKEIELDSQAATKIDGHAENVASQGLIIPFEGKLVKIPREQDLKSLDPVSIYEYKIHGILLLQKILSRFHGAAGSTKEKIREKETKKYQEDTFLEIEVDLLTEVLRER